MTSRRRFTTSRAGRAAIVAATAAAALLLSGCVAGENAPAAGGDSTAAAAVDLLGRCPRATLVVVDGAGHALPHEAPSVLGGVLDGWLTDAVEHDG